MVYDKRHIKRRGCEVEREKSRTLCSRGGEGPKSQDLESILYLLRWKGRSSKGSSEHQVVSESPGDEAASMERGRTQAAVPVTLSSFLLQDGPLPDLPTPAGHSSQSCRGHCDQNSGPISLESTHSYLSLEHTVKVTLTPNPDSRREL